LSARRHRMTDSPDAYLAGDTTTAETGRPLPVIADLAGLIDLMDNPPADGGYYMRWSRGPAVDLVDNRGCCWDTSAGAVPTTSHWCDAGDRSPGWVRRPSPRRRRSSRNSRPRNGDRSTVAANRTDPKRRHLPVPLRLLPAELRDSDACGTQGQRCRWDPGITSRLRGKPPVPAAEPQTGIESRRT
jgi:hypothetical protein